MAKISLRAYNHEIEELIEHNQFDQAIAHCRNILKFHPKYINTYRLLGKSFLESQRYGDAGDIFQRILSSFPEDFISHVGMSIIREDEGNLDDALWHMERAFELQPSNNAIQGELRRLHGKREGAEPSKVRLTRGALAHMYIRGDLFPQAIAELRIALTEDPTRFDLQIELAKAFHLSGQLAEAAKISNEIIGKLPYSFEANRILADIYKKSDRPQEAQTYLQRLNELDPYFAYITESMPSPEQVSDTTVTLDKLDWKPGFTTPESEAQPEWAKSIGINMESSVPQDENMPNWLATPEEESAQPIQEVSPIIDIPEKENEIPSEWQAPVSVIGQAHDDWEIPVEPVQMADELPQQNAEYIQEDTEVFTEDVSVLERSGDMQAEEISPAEIPEWLKSLAPNQAEKSDETPEDITVKPSEPQNEKEFSWLDESPSDQSEKWMADKEEEPTPFSESGEGETEIPGWLQQTSEETVAPEAEPLELDQELIQQELQPVDEMAPDTFKSEEKDEFAWLSEEDSGQLPEDTSSKESTVWMNESEEEPIPLSSDEEDLPPAVEVELPDWLSQMKQDMDQKGEVAKPAQEIPDWIKTLEEPPITEEDTKPTRLSQRQVIQEPTPSVSEQIPESASFDLPEIKEFEETPLSSIFEDESFEFNEEAQEVDSSAFTKADEGEDQLGWLTKMEAKQNLEEGIFQEETPETPPEWVRDSMEETELPTTAQEEPGIIEEVQLPDWLVEALPEPPQEVETVSEVKPDWLNEFESEPSKTEEFSEPIPPTETVFSLPETPLEEVIPEEVEAFPSQEVFEEGISEEIAQPTEEPLPEWLQEYKVEEATVETAIQPVSEQQPITEVPAWFDQPEQLPNLDISFTEEPSTVEEQLPVEEISPFPAEVEPTMDVGAQAEVPEIEIPAPEIPATEMPATEMPATEIPVSEIPVEVQFVPIDLNDASLVELERVPGIGFIKAQTVINFRNEHGAFTSVDDLINVPGFDEALVQEIKPRFEVIVPYEEPVQIAMEAEIQDPLLKARNDLQQGKITEALNQYLELINAKTDLTDISYDLQEAIDDYPMETDLWQTLGDTCVRLGKLQDALNAYTQAEKLLR